MDEDIKLIDTALGKIQVSIQGSGIPVLVIHGSPGGVDAAIAMSRFLPADKFQTICLSRPGYLGTPLDPVDSSIDREADLLAALLDALKITRAGILSWSGGGPSAYRLAVRHPDRALSIVLIAALSSRWVAPKKTMAERIMFGTTLGGRVVDALCRHAPEHLVKEALEGEGSVRGVELEELTRFVMANEAQRKLVLETARTVNIAGARKAGWNNDVENYAKIESLELERVTCPVLLIHGDADTDAVPAYSKDAHASLANSKLIMLENGTHLAFYAHQEAADVQQQACAWFVACG